MGRYLIVIILLLGLMSEHCGSALQCHKCTKMSSEEECNNSPTVSCGAGKACRMTVRERRSGFIYNKGCYRACDVPGQIACVLDRRATCQTCCFDDLCNSDASTLTAYIDRCVDNPCQNGGTCSVSGGGFSCSCPQGYLGPTCEDLTGPYPVWYSGGECGVSKYADAGVGLPSYSRIVGGDVARPNEFPWQVLIRDWVDSERYALCGGMILNRYWILTAAHCRDEARVPMVYFGEHDVTDDVEFSRLVDQTIIHPEWSTTTYVNDIALLRLSSPLPLSDDVTPVCSPLPGETYTGELALVSGWGDTYYHQPEITPKLKYTTMDIVDNQICVDSYAEISHGITDDMLCTWDIYDGVFSTFCNGDSGGPLVSKDSENRFHALGTVSGTIACGPDFPAVFTRITGYLDWIDGHIPMADRA